jgi:hypothetical protein
MWFSGERFGQESSVRTSQMFEFAFTDAQNDCRRALPLAKEWEWEWHTSILNFQESCFFLFLPGNSCHKIIQLFSTAGLPVSGELSSPGLILFNT